MADPQPDGLASLNAQRGRARRSMPPARHPVSAQAPTRTVGDADAPTPAQPAATEPPAKATRPRPATATSSPPPPAAAAPVKVTLYIDLDADEFMEAARVQGLVARPKVDISRSAVVRLALRRLMKEMTAAEVKTLLERQETGTGPGRKRR